MGVAGRGYSFEASSFEASVFTSERTSSPTHTRELEDDDEGYGSPLPVLAVKRGTGLLAYRADRLIWRDRTGPDS
jgi:hypothetical protein